MVGLKRDIDVVCVPIEEGVFGCSYVPEIAGKFSLFMRSPSVENDAEINPGCNFKFFC